MVRIIWNNYLDSTHFIIHVPARSMAFFKATFCSSVRALRRVPHVTPASSLYPTLSQRLYTTPASTSSDEGAGDDELVPERLYSKVNIKVKGADHAVLDSYCRFLITAGKALDIDIGGRVALPTRIQKFTVLKSAHIFKKHRVQYEIRTHARLVQIKQITGTTADVYLEYIQRNLPEGVSMSVYQERMDSLPSLLTSYSETQEPEVKTKKKRQ